MGRTNPTYRDFLRRFEASWLPFRRALRRRHRADFDRLFERAAEHASAAGQANATTPERAALLSMLVSQERELRHLRGRVAALEADGGAPDAERSEVVDPVRSDDD